MLYRGDISEGIEIGPFDADLPDGRVFGPFETEASASAWKQYFKAAPERIVTARDIFTDSVVADEMFVISPEALEYGVHPFREVYDVHVKDDNGNVVMEGARGKFSMHPLASLYMPTVERRPPRASLPQARRMPERVDIPKGVDPSFVKASSHRGEVLSFEVELSGDAVTVVAWRPDSRHSKGLITLSLHDYPDLARRRVTALADTFVPPERTPNRKRRLDPQREALYRWEHTFGSSEVDLGSIEAVEELVKRICADIGIDPPSVRTGRPELEDYSYFSRMRGIVMARSMLTVHATVHEVAHHVVSRMRRVDEPSHGPVFAGVLVALLATYSSADPVLAVDLAAGSGVEVDVVRMEAMRSRLSEVHSRTSTPTGRTPGL